MTVDPAMRRKYAALADDARHDLEEASPEEILTWAVEVFEDKFCITSSMADAVLVDMASRVRPGIDVIFLDTGYHFAETLRTRDLVRERYAIELHVVNPRQSVAEQDAVFGPKLYGRDPDACCNLRKVEPLRRGLEPYFAWGSGIRRDETASRRDMGVVEWDDNRGMVKVNPLASWTEAQVNEYISKHDVVVNALVNHGYPSIGCEPCTRRVRPGEDPRSGRWAGMDKTECGLHYDTSDTSDDVPTPRRSDFISGLTRAVHPIELPAEPRDIENPE